MFHGATEDAITSTLWNQWLHLVLLWLVRKTFFFFFVVRKPVSMDSTPDFGQRQTWWIVQPEKGVVICLNLVNRNKNMATLVASGIQKISKWRQSTANVHNCIMIALQGAHTLSCWDAHFSYVLKIALCFQIIHITHIAPVGLPSFPPGIS